jgi:hypothetical protein
MRNFALAMLIALAGCGPGGEPEAQPQAGCALETTRERVWSNPAAPDTIAARAEGPDCARAFVTLTIRGAEGEPLWAFASSFYAMDAGDGAFPSEPPVVTDERMNQFLASWADIKPQTSDSAPAWREGAAGPSGGTFAYHTPLPREAYETLRTRALPMACYAAGAEAVECLVIDPFSRTATLFMAYGP